MFHRLYPSYSTKNMKVTAQSSSDMSSLSSLPVVDSPSNRFDNIIKSQEDDRQYRGLKLDNGMRVLLVSDSSTDKSAACICVEVGKLNIEDKMKPFADCKLFSSKGT